MNISAYVGCGSKVASYEAATNDHDEPHAGHYRKSLIPCGPCRARTQSYVSSVRLFASTEAPPQKEVRYRRGQSA